MHAPKPKVWFNSEDAAEYLGLTPRQLTRFMHTRRISFYRPSGSKFGPVQFHKEDLDAHMAAHRVEAVAS